MPIRRASRVREYKELADNLDTYTVYAKSPYSHSSPNAAHGIHILCTGDLADESQKNFEVLIQSIGLRAMPSNMDTPVSVPKLRYAGAKFLDGEGYVWKFQVEMADAFLTVEDGVEDPVGLLKKELHGIVLPNGATIVTTVHHCNLEVFRTAVAR